MNRPVSFARVSFENRNKILDFYTTTSKDLTTYPAFKLYSALQQEALKEVKSEEELKILLNLTEEKTGEVLTIWEYCILDKHSPEDFEKFMAQIFPGCNFKFIKEIKRKDSDTRDIFFTVSGNIAQFAVKRMAYNGEIRWYSDVVSNSQESRYTPEDLSFIHSLPSFNAPVEM